MGRLVVHPRQSFASFVFHLLSYLRIAPLSDRFALHKGGLSHADAEHGLWLEFGVWKGETVQIIASYRSKHYRQRPAVIAFDSFLGLPEDWRSVRRPGQYGVNVRTAASLNRGNFALGGRPPKLPGHLEPLVQWKVGWYNESLPAFLSEQSGNVSFLHMDSDLFSSTQTVLSLLGARLQPTSVIVFDELFNYPEYRSHEIRALFEFLITYNYSVEVLASSTHDIETWPRVENFRQSCALRLIDAIS